MFFVAAIRAFALLHAMHTGLAAHQALLVYSDFYVFHCYNVTHKRRFVKRFFDVFCDGERILFPSSPDARETCCP